jgi:hypothetical protein
MENKIHNTEKPQHDAKQPVSGSVFILIDGHGDNLAYIIKDEKELENWKSDGSIEKGDKLYKAIFIEQF